MKRKRNGCIGMLNGCLIELMIVLLILAALRLGGAL